MGVVLLIVAASVSQASTEYSAPRATREDAVRLQRMYPSQALQKRQSAAALIDVFVDPEGRVMNCETVAVYGSKSLGENICGLQKSVRVTPRRIDGMPAYGSYRTLITYHLPGEKQGREVASVRQVADAEFTVASLPNGQTSLRLDLALLIESDGTVAGCKSGDDQHGAFVQAACSQLAPVKFALFKDHAGDPARHVRGFSVEFQLAG